ncbi:MAG: DoxX family protein [Myxococcales bacterium]|nr:DoxX family protein [Myxococcales bacterium]
MLDLPKRRAKTLALLALAAAFIFAGVNHFLNPDFFVAIMPPYLPLHLELVLLSGVFEILGGVAVLVPGVRSLAGWGLILLLLAVFPANLHMALNPELFPDVSSSALYLRLPLQIVFIAWAYWATRPEDVADAQR